MTFNKKLLAATLLTAGGFAAMSSANAAEEVKTFQVATTIDAVCSIDTTSTSISFGNVAAGTTASKISSSIPAKCSNGAPYTIKLTSGNLVSATGEGKMLPNDTTANTDSLTYQLYSDAAGTTVWGSTTGTTGANVVSDTGAGLSAVANSHPLSASITSLTTDIKNDTYTDIVTATITY